jgi:hypothetical protein
MDRLIARMETKRNYKGNPGGKVPLGKPRRRRVDNIVMDIVEIGWGDMDWTGLD